MIVEIKNEQEEKKMKYPCLLVNNKRTIVLATGVGKSNHCLSGVVIRNEFRGCGEYFDDYDKKEFRPFIGEITFKND